MNIDIQAEALTPKRQTFSHVARRIGEGRAASRYEEATYDVQPVVNFHYRPLYAPEFEIYDSRRTSVVMRDWYMFRDPRQLYYATYNMSRAAMQQDFDSKFAFVEKAGLLGALSAEQRDGIASYLVPMRHYEWGANINCQMVADAGYGTQITSAAAFCGMDRLGLSQALSRVGLLLDPTAKLLDRGRADWLEAQSWQGVRHALEDSFVVQDWFETFVAQFLALDGVLHPLVFGTFGAALQSQGTTAIAMLSDFPQAWFADNARWVDAVVKAAAAESDANRQALSRWFAAWSQRAAQAATPLAERVLGSQGRGAVQDALAALAGRAAGLGLST